MTTDRQALPRLNVGCGEWKLPGYVNIDSRKKVRPDLVAKVPPIPMADGSVGEVYAGHFLEHLTPRDANVFLAECRRVLVGGGRLGVLVPDTRKVMEAYLAGRGSVMAVKDQWSAMADLDQVCAVFLYSTVQESPHRWSYDLVTLRRIIVRAGFVVTGEIDRLGDPRIPVPAWYQCGLDAVKPGYDE